MIGFEISVLGQNRKGEETLSFPGTMSSDSVEGIIGAERWTVERVTLAYARFLTGEDGLESMPQNDLQHFRDQFTIRSKRLSIRLD